MRGVLIMMFLVLFPSKHRDVKEMVSFHLDKVFKAKKTVNFDKFVKYLKKEQSSVIVT